MRFFPVRQWGLALLSAALVLMVLPMASADLSPWHVFSPGQAIRASEINQNFQAVNATLQSRVTRGSNQFSAGNATVPLRTLEVTGNLVVTTEMRGQYLCLVSGSTVLDHLQLEARPWIAISPTEVQGQFHSHSADGQYGYPGGTLDVSLPFHFFYDYTGSGPNPDTDTFSVVLKGALEGGALLHTDPATNLRWKLTH